MSPSRTEARAPAPPLTEAGASRTRAAGEAAFPAAAGAVILLHAWGAFAPASYNWGVHAIGFLPAGVQAAALFLMAAALLPGARSFLARRAAACAGFPARIPGPARAGLVVAGMGAAALLFWLARERVFLLGDGNLIARSVPSVRSADDIPALFRHEPLPGFLMWKTRIFLENLGFVPEGAMPVRLVSIACGVLFVPVALLLGGALSRGAAGKALAAALILVSGGAQLFFGYVENYAPLSLAVLLFMLAAVLHAGGRLPAFVPFAAFALMISTHFGTIVFLPVILILLVRAVRARRYGEAAAAIAAGAATGVLLFWLCGYTPGLFLSTLMQGGGHLLSPFGASGEWQAYSLFSPRHLADLANLLLLISPFAALLWAGLLFREEREGFMRDKAAFVLLSAAACGAGFLFLTNFDLGMSRDWDLASSFALPVIVAGAGIWLGRNGAPGERKETALAGIVVATLVHTLLWVGLNASERASLERFRALPDRRLWGKNALLAGYEETAVHYRTKGEPDKALQFLQKCLDVDAGNPRLWGSLAVAYRKAGDQKGEMRAYEGAVRAGTNSWEMLQDLATIYISRQRFSEALPLLERVVRLNPGSAPAHYGIGLVLLQGKRDPLEALPLFRRAIGIDSTLAPAYLGAGACSQQLGDVPGARAYWSAYLKLEPAGPASGKIRALLESAR